MKNGKIIRPYYDKDNELRIGIFANEKSKTPINSTTKYIEPEDLDDILRNIEISERKKPRDQRAEVCYTIQRKNNFVKITSLALAGTVAVTLAGYGVVSLAKSILNDIKGTKTEKAKIEASIDENALVANENKINYEIENTPAPSFAPIVEDKLNTFTTAEKLEFIKNNLENFKNDIELATGIVLNDDEVLIQLGFINGLTLEQIDVYSHDYWLDFAEDYETILQELTIPSVNYLSFNHKIKGSNPSNGTSIYAKYIMDDKDRIVYSYFADRIQSVVSASYEKDKEEALGESYDFVRSIAETIVYPNNPVQKDNVKNYLKVRQGLIKELNKIPSYEELANKMNLTINEVRELEVASLGTTSVSNQVQFILLDVAQVAVQLLPEDTVVEYTNTLGEIDNSILNYNASKGAPANTNPENYEHSKYLMLDIEHFMEDTINLIMSDFENENTLYRLTDKEQEKNDALFNNTDENTLCSSNTKSYTRKLTI